jgi:pyruvate kinase
LSALRVRDVIRLTDARGARRKLIVERRDAQGALLKCEDTTYLVPKTALERPTRGRGLRACRLTALPRRPGSLLLCRGDVLRLVRSEKVPAAEGRSRVRRHVCTIGCTLPEVFAQVRKGERVWLDDGRIGGVVRSASADWMEVEITDAREGGDKLAEDKGINLPDSELKLPALTRQDLADLEVAAACADMVGLSFVQAPSDIDQLRSRLQDLGAGKLGVVLKIETRRAFDNLPALLLAAMKDRGVGVMIARGDLAVECGYERLAEVQEEILWACEAAHMPVIWATQVLETLAKTGRPSRSEITDAAMSERAECVMLNKGPFIVDAMRTLDDILRRMQAHQSKKRPLLRALRAWQLQEAVTAPAT